MASRSRGDIPDTLFNQIYPYQVALTALEVRFRFHEVEALSKQLECSRLNKSAWSWNEGYIVYCFALKAQAETFLKAFDAEWVDPKELMSRKWRSRWQRIEVGRFG
ncbi:hypothetical protein [Phyllobacterium meliloti]|uniref:hypothetical protein n=1 Tax=Phyllobacterium meliloti TaxID=555317 RepID=UPI001D138817|nr:hypothetical protein [Phyllobacterium sp. T1293]UGX87148.1 hypothetical protein LLE53_004685 [Phyllobacterium sp. T1293]